MVQTFFKSFDRLADRRLGNKKLPGCLGEAQSSGNIIKYFVQFQTDIHNDLLVIANSNIFCM